MALTVDGGGGRPPAEYSPRGLEQLGEPGSPLGDAAREQARSREMQGSGLAPPAHRMPPMGDSPLLQGLEPGSAIGGVGMRTGRPSGPQPFTSENTGEIMRTIDRRAGGDRARIDDLGLRAVDGLTRADPSNLRMSYDPNSGAMSIDRQFIREGRTDWERVWSGRAPAADSKDPAAAWALETRDAGNALARSYREQPYNNRGPLPGNAFPDAARGAIDGVQPPAPRPGQLQKPLDWGLPRDQRRT